jgi:type I restriction enzyme M protein
MKYQEQIEKVLNSIKDNIVTIIKDSAEVHYNSKIKQYQKIKSVKGGEEYVRAYLISRLVNDLDYKPELIEIEKEYQAGRPKPTKARIDVIVRDSKGNSYFFIEVKSPEKFESDKNIIEGQLYQLAKLEGGDIKYLVYYTIDIKGKEMFDKAIIIDYKKYPTFADWEKAGFPSIADELPARYGKPQKEPLIKGGKRDLNTDITRESLTSIRNNLHNVLWGGSGTTDTEIFYSLVNIILAKIQDESEKEKGQKYDFQVFQYGDELENSEKLFERINNLYRRALKEKLNITEERKLDKAFVINEEKFPLNKLLYTVQTLEDYSFVEGKSSLDGRDILGEFFEGIIRDGFKQTKGQFFTPINIVKFIIYALKIDELSINRLNEDRELPYIIDPACGSGTFLIEVMKTITKEIKYQRKHLLKNNKQVQDRFEELFMPDHKEHRWARDYVYGIDANFDLGTAAKVNMILHGDGSMNIFVKDGLLPFRFYDKVTAPNFLKQYETEENYLGKEINGQFEIVISNPPFSVELDNETKRYLSQSFIYGDKKNSENLFIERWYQLLKPGGRMGIVLPESVFDTTENKYIRLFLFKYFWIKAVVSLPQLTFEPYTSTKTSLLFAKKKTTKEIEEWDNLWTKYGKEFQTLKTRVENYVEVYLTGKDKSKLPSIKNHTETEIRKNIERYLKNFIEDEDKKLKIKELLQKCQEEIIELGAKSNLNDEWVNEWWVFGEVSKEMDYSIFMAEAENIGYKRTKRGEKPMPNDLFEEKDGKIDLSDRGDKILNLLKKTIEW